jgi:hypothetical protein
MNLLSALSIRPWQHGVRALATTVLVVRKRVRESVRDR